MIFKTFYLSGVAAKSAVQMDKSSSQTAGKKQKHFKISVERKILISTYIQ